MKIMTMALLLLTTWAGAATQTITITTNPVTQITAGTNVTISPTSGKGNVTINATGGGGGDAYLASSQTWSGQNVYRATTTFYNMVNISSQPYLRLVSGLNQVIPNATETPVFFQSAIQSNGFNWIVTSSNTITIPYDGVYGIATAITWAAAANGIRMLYVKVDGNYTYDVDSGGQPGTGVISTINFNAYHSFTAGQVLTFNVYQNSGATQNLSDTNRRTFVTITKIQ